MKPDVSIECAAKIRDDGSRPRLVFIGHAWDEWGMELPFCVHGEKLRWTCDACDEYFAENKPKKGHKL